MQLLRTSLRTAPLRWDCDSVISLQRIDPLPDNTISEASGTCVNTYTSFGDDTKDRQRGLQAETDVFAMG